MELTWTFADHNSYIFRSSERIFSPKLLALIVYFWSGRRHLLIMAHPFVCNVWVFCARNGNLDSTCLIGILGRQGEMSDKCQANSPYNSNFGFSVSHTRSFFYKQLFISNTSQNPGKFKQQD